MNTVMGMIQLLQDTPLSPEQRDSLKMMSESAKSLLELLNTLLDFSKIEQQKFELNVRYTFPSHLLATALQST